MAYWLYKKIRDRKRNSGEQHLLGPYPAASDRNEAPAGIVSSDKETSRLDPQPQESPGDSEAQRAARVYRWRLIGGLFLPATVQALNTTLIAGALPFIASDFNEFAQINWIVTAYNLTAAAFIPIVSARCLLSVCRLLTVPPITSSGANSQMYSDGILLYREAVSCSTTSKAFTYTDHQFLGITWVHDFRKCTLRWCSRG